MLGVGISLSSAQVLAKKMVMSVPEFQRYAAMLKSQGRMVVDLRCEIKNGRIQIHPRRDHKKRFKDWKAVIKRGSISNLTLNYKKKGYIDIYRHTVVMSGGNLNCIIFRKK